jgi:hypothetical protein
MISAPRRDFKQSRSVWARFHEKSVNETTWAGNVRSGPLMGISVRIGSIFRISKIETNLAEA